MTGSRFALSLLLAMIPAEAFAAGPVVVPSQFVEEILVTNLSQPNGMAFAPDGRLFVTEQLTGRIRMIVSGHLAATDPAGTVPSVNPGGERGLQGIAVDPRWPASPYVYVCYNRVGPREVVLRMTATGDLTNPLGENIVFGSPLEIIGDIRDQFDNHNGGCVRFGPDGMLYVSLGEDSDRCSSQQPDSLRGKLLRLDVSQLPPGGGGPVARALITPADNPIPGPTANARLVFAYGLRNPWRFSIDALNGRIILGDVGENVMEEVDEIVPGGNYGWPYREGTGLHFQAECQEPGGPGSNAYEEPLVALDRSTGYTAIEAAGIYRPVPGGANWPGEYQGDAFFGDYYVSGLRRLKYTAGEWVTPPPVPGQPDADNWATGMYWAVDFAVGPDGSLWWLKAWDDSFNPSSGMVRRIRYTGPADVASWPVAAVSLRAAPNPSFHETALWFTLPAREPVSLVVFDLHGREVRELMHGEVGPGDVAATWDGTDARGARVAPGMYLARLVRGTRTESVRLLRLN
jgi:glucose/arabinose dehydrogenase